MTKRMATTLLSLAALMQVACGGKKSAAIAQFQQQCNTQACIDMYTNAAKNAGIVGPAAAASLPQVAAVGAPVLPGQVTNTTLLPASVTDTQVAAQQAKITSQLQAIVAAQPTATVSNAVTGASSTTPTAQLSVASVSGGSSAVSVGVTRLPASDIEPLSTPASTAAATPQLTSATGVYQPASLDSGSALQGESASGAGAGH